MTSPRTRAHRAETRRRRRLEKVRVGRAVAKAVKTWMQQRAAVTSGKLVIEANKPLPVFMYDRQPQEIRQKLDAIGEAAHDWDLIYRPGPIPHG